jgi:hypothetical protein
MERRLAIVLLALIAARAALARVHRNILQVTEEEQAVFDEAASGEPSFIEGGPGKHHSPTDMLAAYLREDSTLWMLSVSM